MSTRKQHRNPWLQEAETGQPLFMASNGQDSGHQDRPRFFDNVAAGANSNGGVGASVGAGQEKATSSRHAEMDYAWCPSDKHLEVLAARNIPEDFVSEQVFSFQAHYEGKAHTNWDGQFVKWVWKSWTQFGGQKRFNESVSLEDEIGADAAAVFRNVRDHQPTQSTQAATELLSSELLPSEEMSSGPISATSVATTPSTRPMSTGVAATDASDQDLLLQRLSGNLTK